MINLCYHPKYEAMYFINKMYVLKLEHKHLSIFVTFIDIFLKKNNLNFILAYYEKKRFHIGLYLEFIVNNIPYQFVFFYIQEFKG